VKADGGGPLRAFLIRGAAEVVEVAVDWLHVHADVAGVAEQDGATTVWCHGGLPKLAVDGVVVTELPPELANAEATGLEHDAPIWLASDLLVRPPWVTRPTDFEGIELVVPRGMAFGSGEHASTRAALLLMHRVWRSVPTFADVGTGSGILLLYAAVRGAQHMCACDVEQPAVDAATELVPAAQVVVGGPDMLPFRADFLVANMTGSELAACFDDLMRVWTGVGPLVLSGMREHEVGVIEARSPASATHRLRQDEFTALAWLGR
jgi:ribosomal protein L11 methylase PrmA